MDDGAQLELGTEGEFPRFYLKERPVRTGEYLEVRLPDEFEWRECRFMWPFILDWVPTIFLDDGRAIALPEGSVCRWPLDVR